MAKAIEEKIYEAAGVTPPGRAPVAAVEPAAGSTNGAGEAPVTPLAREPEEQAA